MEPSLGRLCDWVRDSWGFAVIYHMPLVEILCSRSLLGGKERVPEPPTLPHRCTWSGCQGLAEPNLAPTALGSAPCMALLVGPSGGTGGRGMSCRAAASCEGTARMGVCGTLLAVRTWGHLP